MDHQWYKPMFRELLEQARTAVKQILFSYYPWRDVSSFFITILLILSKMKTSFLGMKLPLKKKKIEELTTRKKTWHLGTRVIGTL